MAEAPAADPDEKKDEDVTPVWTPPEGGGTTEATEHAIGELDDEERAFNESHKPAPQED